MTPKEKAKQLIKRYACLSRGENINDWIDKDIIFDFFDIECALIAVDEIEKEIYTYYERFDFWKKVKQEIEKL